MKWATYSVSTVSRWRRWTISIRSSSSRRTVPIQRSAIAFARGARTGVRRMRMASLAKTGIEDGGERGIAVPDHGPELSRVVAEVHQKIPRLLGDPGATGVGRDAEQVDAAGACSTTNSTQSRCSSRVPGAEEVGGQNALGSGQPELAPTRPAAAGRGIDAGALGGSTPPCWAQAGSRVRRVHRGSCGSPRSSSPRPGEAPADAPRTRWTGRRCGAGGAGSRVGSPGRGASAPPWQE